jgi:hypothetical protein
MRIVRHTDPDFQKQLASLKRRSEPAPEVRKTVAEIIEAVRAKGDAAVLDYTARFGGPKLKAAQLLVTGRVPEVEARVERAIAAAHANVLAFAGRGYPRAGTAANSACARRTLLGIFLGPTESAEINPPELGFEVLSELPAAMHAGLMIQYRVRPLLGIPLRWLTEITQVEPMRTSWMSNASAPIACGTRALVHASR